SMHAFEFHGDEAVIRAAPQDSAIGAAFAEVFGKPIVGQRVPLAALQHLKAFFDGGAVFVSNPATLVRDLVGGGAEPETLARLEAAALPRGLLCPIVIGGRRWGGLFL